MITGIIGYTLGVVFFALFYTLFLQKCKQEKYKKDKYDMQFLIVLVSMAWPILPVACVMVGAAIIGIKAAQYLQGNKEEC